jgi:hypothetical protein
MKNSKLLKCLVIGLMLFGFYVGLNALIMLNGIPPCAEGWVPIPGLTVNAASNFLQSNADMLLFLNEVEISEINGFNYVRSLELIDSAIEKLEKARANYDGMVVIADGPSDRPCDKMVANGKLLTFDYEGLVAKEGLNKEIMSLATAYLVKGDIAGVYKKVLADVDLILADLYTMRDMLKKEVQPSLASCWTLLHRYSDTILFGNYITLVFYHL